jgi:hypothetical protein
MSKELIRALEDCPQSVEDGFLELALSIVERDARNMAKAFSILMAASFSVLSKAKVVKDTDDDDSGYDDDDLEESPRARRSRDADLDEDDETPTPRRRKAVEEEEEDDDDDFGDDVDDDDDTVEEEEVSFDEEDDEEEKPARGRGRRAAAVEEDEEEKPARGRGRPRGSRNTATEPAPRGRPPKGDSAKAAGRTAKVASKKPVVVTRGKVAPASRGRGGTRRG